MCPQPKAFKPVPKKFHPKGLGIVYEDHDILVVDKRPGLLTVAYEDQPEEISAYELLMRYVCKDNPKSFKRVHMVHRLDRDTSGVMVFAKSEAAREYLIDEWPNFTKTYQAVVGGHLLVKSGTISSYLAENAALRMYSVTKPEDGAFASTSYKVLRESKNRSLLELELHTGKKNQIRVHLSEKGHPVLGDRKYGDKTPGIQRLALHSATLRLNHPHTKEPMVFEAPVPDYFAALMR